MGEFVNREGKQQQHDDDNEVDKNSEPIAFAEAIDEAEQGAIHNLCMRLYGLELKMKRLLRWFEFNWLYFRHPPWDTKVSPPELFAYMQGHSTGRALDMGCGTGTNVMTLAHKGWQAVGVDFALKAIVEGRRTIQRAGLQDRAELRVGSVTDLRDVSGPFDLILDIGCYHGMPAPDRRGYIDNVNRLLRPGGHWLLYTFLKRDATDDRGVDDVEIYGFASALRLVQREDGRDGSRRRASAWMLFERG